MRHGPSRRVLTFLAAVSASTAAIVPLANSARGDLDRIAADGVTEVGGSATYARMLPRTGADGRLDASLLPPVADWASAPISNLYYMAGNAAVQGNGSPQYPFKTLTYALSHMLPQSALFVAPATYSGSLSLASGRTVALVGFGPASYVSSLSVTVSGSSASTCLALVGLRVGTLSITGGRVNVKLSHSTVDQLGGSSSAATVTRMDLGSLVAFSSLAHTDVYAGYDTVPYANVMKNPDGTSRMVLSGNRATVEAGGRAYTVAYMEDIAAATNNGLSVAIQGLREADTALAGDISSEAAARRAGDAAISNRINTINSTLSLQIAGVGTSWGGQLSTLSRAISGFQDELAAIRADMTNDVVSLNRAISEVETAYQAADTMFSIDLAALSTAVNDLSRGLAATIDTRAETVADRVISAQQTTIESNVTAAVSGLVSDLRGELTRTINNKYDDLNRKYTRLATRYDGLATSVSNINRQYSTLSSGYSTLSSRCDGLDNSISAVNRRCDTLDSRYTTLNSRCDALDLRCAALGSRCDGLATSVSNLTTALNALIDALAAADNGSSFTNAYGITLPATLE